MSAADIIRKAYIDEATKAAMLAENAENTATLSLGTLLAGINTANTATNARTALGLGTAATTAATDYATAAQGTKADAALPNTLTALDALLATLPTADPMVAGKFWLNSGVVTKSAA